MKILHVIPFGIFTIGYVNSFNRYSANSHTFWMYGYSREYEIKHNILFETDKNVMRIDSSEFPSFENEYNSHDIIIFLCIPENLQLLNLIYKCYQNDPKPYILSPWGRDADRTSDIYNMKKADWISIDQLKRWLVIHSACIASTQKLYDVLNENYHVKSARTFFGNNLLAFESNKLSALDIMKPHDKLRIMLGHRGTSTCRHLEMMRMLMPYKKEIEYVVCPLSYGETSYIKKLNRTGKIKFKNKWRPISQWMDTDSYMHFLNENVDVAIFAGKFEGASTIYALLYMGKTVYLNEQSETAEILNDIGVSYYELDSACKKIQLKILSDEEQKKNRELMSDFGSVERFNKQWTSLINDCYQNWQNDKEESL